MKYKPEEIADIKDREAKGLEALKELQLTPAAQISKVNMGNDVFADQVIPYLRDIKYKDEPTPSPAPPTSEKPVEDKPTGE